jgi:hypothetical protein
VNAPVDAPGRASVAGLSAAFRPADLPKEDSNWHFLPTTKNDNTCAFDALAWEVCPTPEYLMYGLHNGVGVTLVVKEGHRPPSPVHRHVSDCIWKVIEEC